MHVHGICGANYQMQSIMHNTVLATTTLLPHVADCAQLHLMILFFFAPQLAWTLLLTVRYNQPHYSKFNLKAKVPIPGAVYLSPRYQESARYQERPPLGARDIRSAPRYQVRPIPGDARYQEDTITIQKQRLSKTTF